MIAITGRVQKLRDKMANAVPEVCLDRGRLMTESYRETEGQPEVIRRARALEKTLAEMTIGIDDGELIVGKVTSRQRGGPLIPEHQWKWYLDEMDIISEREWDRFAPLTEEEKARMMEFLPYWKGRSLYEKWHAMCPEGAAKLVNIVNSASAYCMANMHFGHIGIEGERVLTKGLKGLRKEVDEEISRLNPAFARDLEKSLFFKAVNITLDAVAAFARRYATLAASLAAKEDDAQRKTELEKIAEICARVPEKPATTFHEALQSIWLIYAAIMIEGPGNGIGLGRADQYLFPFYRRDIEEGRITREQALELIELVFVKLNGAVPLQGGEMVRTFGGLAIGPNITIGGVTRDGKDAVNELTYLFLDADESVRLMAPDIVVRIHKSNPDAYVLRVVEALKTLKGKFKFVSDEVTIEQLLRDSKPLESARDYVTTGCVTPSIPGFSHDIAGATFNTPLMLELALNNGVSRLTGEQIGPQTGDPREFTTYDELWNAFTTQLTALLPISVIHRTIDRKLYAEFCPAPFLSVLYPPCIRNGRDITHGGTLPYVSHATMFAGTPNVADSLAAIKKAVFDDKKITMDRLITALDKNFEGEEEMLHILEECPKFGNDDDYVDSIMRDILEFASAEVAKYESIPGGLSTAAVLAITSNISLGAVVGALPEGRKAGLPLADGGMSPCQGKNVSGPTATMRSVSKVDHVKLSGGCVLNMRFNPDALKDTSKMHRFASLIRTFFETGGSFVQFNIVDNETLRDAQRNHEKYKDLLVRVSTYSAYFVELSPELQNEIIARLEIQGV